MDNSIQITENSYLYTLKTEHGEEGRLLVDLVTSGKMNKHHGCYFTISYPNPPSYVKFNNLARSLGVNLRAHKGYSGGLAVIYSTTNDEKKLSEEIDKKSNTAAMYDIVSARHGAVKRRFERTACPFINAVEEPGGRITSISHSRNPTVIHGEMSCKEFYTRLLEFVQHTEPTATIEDLHCLILYFPGGKIAHVTEPIGTGPPPPLPPGLVRIGNKLD